MVNETNKETIKQAKDLPLVALVGPTNAGKSTLFNRFVGLPQAVTAHEEGTTRDRVLGLCTWQNQTFSLVDTAGLFSNDHAFTDLSSEQAKQAINEADLVLFTYDGRLPLSDNAKAEINKLRHKKIFLVANKIDSYEIEQVTAAPNLGLPFFPVSARAGRRTGDLLQTICQTIEAPKDYHQDSKPIVAIIGRPNVGKSTLLNSLTQSNRSIVSHIAGTTRDVVTHSLWLKDKEVILADTAGIRRRGKINLGPELFSVKRAATMLEQATAVLVIIDAYEGVTRGDIHMLQFAKDLRKPILIVYNKIDQLPENKPLAIRPFLAKYPSVTISAKEQTNINTILDWIEDQLA